MESQSTDAGIITERVMVKIGDLFPDLPTPQFNALYSTLLKELEKCLRQNNRDEPTLGRAQADNPKN